MGKRVPDQCAYCGELGATRDHVPPKGLYARPLPSGLITVPACSTHNTGSSLDDEYFRAMLSFRQDAHDRSEAAGAAQRALHRILRPESEGFLRSFLRSMTEYNITTPTGSLEPLASYDVDMPRLTSVVERTVRGLFYYHTGVRLTVDRPVTVYPVESLRRDPPSFARFAPAVSWAYEAAAHATPRNVLQYRYRQTDADPLSSVWLLNFYESVPFVAVTLSRPSR